MRWDSYVDRVDEKVSKKEIDDALKNDNILIGCEFEFISDEPLNAMGSDFAELYNSATQEVKRYNEDIDTYEKDVDEYREDTESLKSDADEMQEKIDVIGDAIDAQTDHTDELQTEIEELESENDDLDDKISNLGDGDSQTALESLISSNKSKIILKQKSIDDNNDKEAEWQDEMIEFERNIKENDEDIKYREEEGEWEHIETPYASVESMPSYFEYMTEYMGWSKSDLETEPGSQLNHLPDYDNGNYDFDGDFEGAIESTGMLDMAPFDDYVISDYGDNPQKVGDKFWSIEPDSSLSDDGLEVKNPPMKLPKFMNDYLDDMFKWINSVGYTDSSCGFHCHMSLRKTIGDLDFLKLVLFTDEEWIYTAFEERANTNYSKSVKDKIKSGTILNKRDLDDLFKKKKLIMKMQISHEHFDAINVLDAKTGHVEFRYMGGTDYSKKLKDVRATIGVYAHNLSLAMDPNYKRKEYQHKLQRVFNKMELFFLGKMIDRLVLLRDDTDNKATPADKKVIWKREREIRSRYKQLSSVYKLDSKTIKSLERNTAFMRGIHTDVEIQARKGLSKALES